MNEIYLEKLPRKNGKCNKIDWSNSVDYFVKFKYEDIEGEIEIVDYDIATSYLKVKFNNNTMKIHSGHFAKVHLGKLLKKVTCDFKIEIGATFKDEKRDITIIDRKYVTNEKGWKEKYYKYRCNKCGFECGEHYRQGEYQKEMWILEGHLLTNNVGCANCCVPHQIVVEGINDIPTTAPWMVKYFQGGYDEAKKYSKGANKNLYFKCPDCGRIKTKLMDVKTLYSRKSIKCVCKDGISYPEKLMYNMLEQLNVEFIYQLSKNDFEWIKSYLYDFYFELNNKKYIIETDGAQHKNERNNGSKWMSLKKQKHIDDLKDKLAKNNNIKTIRIDCEISDIEFIKNNILNSELNNLFDLTKIDWLKCEEFALSNLCKKACKIKRDNPNMTTKDISYMMKISISTITKYLKIGTELNWCYYNAKDEVIKSIPRRTKICRKNMNGKSVEIFKDDISLGVFPSCSELSRQSEELFNVYIDARRISDICNGKKNQYKGFVFKYINN